MAVEHIMRAFFAEFHPTVQAMAKTGLVITTHCYEESDFVQFRIEFYAADDMYEDPYGLGTDLHMSDIPRAIQLVKEWWAKQPKRAVL